MPRTQKSSKARKKTLHDATTSPAFPVWVTAVLLTAAIFVAYFPVIGGGFIWDDDAHITRAELRSVGGLWRIWSDLEATQQYYPLLHSAFWVEHKLFGDAPAGYHIVNIIFHAVAAFLLLLILRRLEIPGAYLAVGIFLLHPVQVESVAWITEQKNTLSAIFYFAAMLSYLYFDEKRRPPIYLLAFALFGLGLLTKTVTATLPAALLVIFWWQRGSLSWKRDGIPLVPWFAIGATAGLFTGWVERKIIGAEGAEFELSLLERCLLAGRVLWFYSSKVFWPVNLTFSYPRWEVNSGVWWQYLFPFGIALLLVILWLIRTRWRGPLAGCLFFIGSLFPVLGFLNVYPFIFSFVADHFQYLASLGLIVGVSAGMSRAFAKASLVARRAGQALAVGVLALLAILTWQQSQMYSDAEALYRSTVRSNPDSWLFQINLGNLLMKQGRIEEAIEHQRQALRVKSDSPDAHYSLGAALSRAGRIDEAMNHYAEAIRNRPNFVEAHNDMAAALFRVGRLTEAINEYELALRIRPNYVEAHYNLGDALFQTGRLSDAINHYKRAIQIRPNYPEAHNNLGAALLQLGRVPEAVEHYQKRVEIEPDSAEAHNNLGVALFRMGRIKEAIDQYQRAFEISPDFAQAHYNMGNALVSTGGIEEAKKHYEEALRISPDFAQARQSLVLLEGRH